MGRWIAIAVLSVLGLVLGITLVATSATLDNTEHDLDLTRSNAANILAELAQAKLLSEAELGNTQSELSDTEAELAQSEAELGNTQSELSDTEAELAQSKAELANTQSQLYDSEAELADLQESFSKLEAVTGITFNGKLEVSDISAPRSTVSGKVKNVGDEPLKKVVILVAFYAEDGSLTDYGYHTVEALFIGETAEWSVYEWGWTTFDIYAFTDK